MNRTDTLIRDLCDEIDELNVALQKAESDASLWRKKHDDLVMNNISHGHKMMAEIVMMFSRPQR